MARTYVSSTSADLADHRKEISQALRRLGHEDVAMEYYVAEDTRPVERCLSDVGSCDVYVGIFAWRYGHIPEDLNPEGRSITELEYRRALADGKECLIFLLSEDAVWPRSKQDKDMTRIEALRDELAGGRHTVNFFSTADELARKVSEAVIAWEKRNNLIMDREPADWLAYREAVLDRHQWVRLQVIAGASRQRDPLRIPLTEVFEPQFVIAGASGTDVPDEVRQYQQEIYGARELAADQVAADAPDGAFGEDDEPLADDDEDADVEAEDTEDAENDAEDDAEDADPLADQLFAGSPEQVLSVLSRERTQVFLGGPGSGKSTLAQYAMLRVCGPAAAEADAVPRHLTGEPVPFLVELRTYVLDKHPDFVSHLVSRSRDFYGAELSPGSVTTALAGDGQAIVFFDGLDEVFDPDERRRVVDQFQAFARQYPSCRIVVTSRIAGYDRTSLGLAGFTHYTVMPLTVAHIRNFADRWYQYYSLEGTGRTAHGLVQRIVESPRLLDLAGNPLLLTMMTVIYKDRDLPNERWRLYQRCAETLLEDWDLVGKGIETEDFKLAVEIRTEQKSQMLQQIARYMLEHARAGGADSGSELNAIAYGPLQTILGGYLSAKYLRPEGEAAAIAVSILRHLMERTYVLAGVGERIFGFVHRTFMEYFAACDCLREFNNRGADFNWLNGQIFGAHWQDPAWEEPLLLLIAMLHDQGTPISGVIDQVARANVGWYPYNFAAAARLLGEAGIPQDQGQGQRLLAELAAAVVSWAASSSAGAKDFVGKALGAFANLAAVVTAPPIVDRYIAHLSSEGANVASRIAGWQMGFALRTSKERLDYAIAALTDKEEAVRRGAIAALEREWPGRTDLGPVLANVVRTDRHSRVSLAALTVMQRSWRYEPSILAAIDARAGKDDGYTVVRRLIEYLASAWPGDARALAVLLRLARPRPGWGFSAESSVASAAAAAITRSWPDLDSEVALVLGLAAWAPEPRVRLAVMHACAAGQTDGAGVLGFLREQAVSDQSPAARGAFIDAIFACWPRENTPELARFALDRLANDPAASVRTAMIRAIALNWERFDSATRSSVRKQAGNDADPLVRLTMTEALSVSDGVPAARAAALRALAARWVSLNAELRSFVSQRMSGDPVAAVREATVRALGEVQRPVRRGRRRSRPVPVSPDIIRDLISILEDRAAQDPAASVRAAAITALTGPKAWFDNSDVRSFVRERAIRDSSEKVRAAALRGMIKNKKFHTQEYQKFILDRAVADIGPSVRAAALEQFVVSWPLISAFCSLGYLKKRGSDDPDPSVRSKLLLALANKNLGPRAFLGEWLADRARNDPDEGVRTALSAALESSP